MVAGERPREFCAKMWRVNLRSEGEDGKEGIKK